MGITLPDFASVGFGDPRAAGTLPVYPSEDPGAQGLAILGKGVQVAGGALEDIAADRQRKQNQVNSALATADLEGNLIRTKEAIKNETDPAKIDALKGQLQGHLENASQIITDPGARALWSARHSVKIAEADALGDVQQHKVYNDKFLAGASAQLDEQLKNAAQASDPADRESAKHNIGAIIGSLTEAGVISEAHGQKLMQDYGQKIITGTAHWLDANDQPGAALDYLKQNMRHVDPQTLDSLTASLKTKKNRADAVGLANGIWGGTSASGGAVTTQQGDTGQKVAATLRARGWSDAAIVGALNNGLTESGLDPNIKGAAGEVGIFQFHPKSHLPAFRASYSGDNSPEAQANYVADVIEKTMPGYAQSGDSRDATSRFFKEFEKPADQSAGALSVRGGNTPTAQAILARTTRAPEDGGAAPTPVAPGGPAGPPDIDALISKVYSSDATPEAKETAITMIQGRYHHFMAATHNERDALTKSLNNGIAALADGKDWTPPDAAIQKLLPPATAADYRDKIDEARVSGQQKLKVWNASPQDAESMWVDMQKGLNDPDATDYAKRRKYADAYLTAWKQRDETLKQDPAAFVLTTPTVSAARATIDPKNPTPGTEATIRASLAEQSRLGVQPEEQRVLTKGQAQDLVTQIAKSDPEKTDLGLMLDQKAQSFGAYWDQAFGDLVKGGLPPSAQAIATMTSPEQAVARVDFQRMLQVSAAKGGVAKLKEAAPSAQTKLVDAGIDDKMADFRPTIMDRKQYDAIKESVKSLAYYYAYSEDGDTALTHAYEGILGSKYDFDGALRVPKGTLGTVEQAGSAILASIKPADLGPVNGNPLLTPDRRQQIYADAIPRGQWIANERDDGVVLMLRLRDNAMQVARYGDGRRVEFKFSQAPELAKAAPLMNTAPPYTGP